MGSTAITGNNKNGPPLFQFAHHRISEAMCSHGVRALRKPEGYFICRQTQVTALHSHTIRTINAYVNKGEFWTNFECIQILLSHGASINKFHVF